MNKGFKKTFEKPKNIFLKPENIFVNERYAFNFNPSGQPKIGKLNSLKEWIGVYSKFLLHTLKGCKVELFVEISCTGRYHFHGYIKITDKIKFYTCDVHELQLNGTSIMKVIDNEEVWGIYCNKQQSFIQPHLKDEIYGVFVEFDELINISNMPVALPPTKKYTIDL